MIFDKFIQETEIRALNPTHNNQKSISNLSNNVQNVMPSYNRHLPTENINQNQFFHNNNKNNTVPKKNSNTISSPIKSHLIKKPL